MCNDCRLHVDVASIVDDFAELKIKIRFSDGRPNIEARDDVKITIDKDLPAEDPSEYPNFSIVAEPPGCASCTK